MTSNQTNEIIELGCHLINNDLLDVIPHAQPSQFLEILRCKVSSLLFPHNFIPFLSSNRIWNVITFSIHTRSIPAMPLLGTLKRASTLEVTCFGEPRHGVQHSIDITGATADTAITITPGSAIAYDSIAQ